MKHSKLMIAEYIPSLTYQDMSDLAGYIAGATDQILTDYPDESPNADFFATILLEWAREVEAEYKAEKAAGDGDNDA